MLESELETARQAGALAARIVADHFEQGVESWSKHGGEPVSAADLQADAAITRLLHERFPHDGLLTEESDDGVERLACERVWVVDPLDGTLDFVSGNPEFAVHIALVRDGRPVLSVVESPMQRRTYYAVRGEGAWMEEPGQERKPLSTTTARHPLRVVTSRLRQSERLERMLDQLPGSERLYSGSSGLKAAMVASGACDIYFAATSKMKEWDLCAPHLLVEEAGGRCTDLFGGELTYNKQDVRALQGLCVTCGPIHDEVVRTLEPVARSFPWFTRP